MIRPRRSLRAGLFAALVLACATPGKERVTIEDPAAYQHGRRFEALYAKDEFAAALAEARRAESLAETLSPSDRLSFGLLLSAGGYDVLHHGLLRLSLEYYERAAFWLEPLAGEQAADEYLEALHSQANLWGCLGNYQAAEELLRRAQDRHDRIGAAHTARSAETLRLEVVNLYNWRRYREALDRSERALAAAEEAQSDSVRAAVHQVRGAVLRQMLAFDEGEREYDCAIELHRKLGLAEEIARDLRFLGELSKERAARFGASKELALARERLAEALAILPATADPRDHLQTRQYLAEIDLGLGRVDEALASFLKLREEYARLGYRESVGRMSFHAAETLRERAKGCDGEQARDDLGAAAARYAEAIEVYRDLDDREFLRLAYFGLGICREELGEDHKAKEAYRSALRLHSDLLSEFDGGKVRTGFEFANRELYKRALPLLFGPKAPSLDESAEALEALDQVLRARQTAGDGDDPRIALVLEVFPEVSVEVRRLLAHGAALDSTERDLMNEELALLLATRGWLGRELAGSDPTPLGQSRTRFKKTVADLSERLAQRDGTDGARVSAAERIQLIDLLAFVDHDHFPPDAAVLIYVPLDTDCFVFVGRERRINFERLEPGKVPLDRTRLASLVDAYCAAVLKPGSEYFDYPDGEDGPRTEALKEAGRALFGALVAPIWMRLADVNTVAVLALDEVSKVPFHALLRTPEEGGGERFLVEERAFLYLPTLRAPNEEERWQLKAPWPDGTLGPGALVLSHPSGGLRSANAQIAALHKHLPGSRLQHVASEKLFHDKWRSYPLVHVVAHGYPPSRGGYVELDSGDLADPKQDGRLEYSEIELESNPGRPPLLFLCCCDTAAEPGYEPGLGGAPNAFLKANDGAPAPIVCTLWRVPDEPRSLGPLVDEFYGELFADVRPERALQRAQIKALSLGGQLKQPLYWAAFAYVGPLY